MALYHYYDTTLGQWVPSPIADHTHTFEPEVVVQTGQPSGAKTVLWVDTDEDYPPSMGRNKIINGDFSVNQRAFISGTANAYGLDRWGGYKVGGGTLTYSVQTPALGELPESARAYARLAVSGQSAAGDVAELYQSIENVRSLSGKTVTVSFWAKAASGTPKVAVEFDQYFGGGGSPSADVYTYAGQVTLSTVWTRYSVTVAIPSVVGKVLGTSGNDALSLELITSAGSNFNARTGSLGIQSATIDFWGVQVEEGSYPSAFEQKSYADELRACQRYYWRMVQSETYTGIGMAATLMTVAIRHPVPMRAAVTPTYTGTIYVTEPNVNVWPVTGISAVGNPANYQTVQFNATAATGAMTLGRGVYLQPQAGGYIEFNAEL